MRNNINELEQRVQDFPLNLSGECPDPKCGGYVIFDYVGVQKSRIKEPMGLYNCKKCHGTFEYKNLVNNYSAKPIVLSQ